MSTGQYFGQKWDAPAFDYAAEVPVPVGQACGYCSELVAAEDSGTLEVFVDENEHAHIKPAHIECLLRATLGSPAHLEGRCTCFGREEPEDERSWREQGRVVRAIVENKNSFHL